MNRLVKSLVLIGVILLSGGQWAIGQNTDFHIQISASKKLIDHNTLKLEPEFRDLVNVILIDGWYKYYIGNFKTHQEAQDYLTDKKIQGFIATYSKGKVVHKGIDKYPNITSAPAAASEEKPKPAPARFSFIPLRVNPVAPEIKKETVKRTDIAKGPDTSRFEDPRDGDSYLTVKIGDQTWMAENLRFGDEKQKSALEKRALGQQYGLLYDYKTALTACPQGWHLPTDAEWITLEENLGVARGQLLSLGYREGSEATLAMKSADHWKSKGSGTNESGFNIYPAGMIKKTGSRVGSGERAYFWTSTKTGLAVWIRQFRYNSTGIIRGMTDPDFSMSVRCIKD
jgi:uncharacterized protein (TIGR02145 family)